MTKMSLYLPIDVIDAAAQRCQREGIARGAMVLNALMATDAKLETLLGGGKPDGQSRWATPRKPPRALQQKRKAAWSFGIVRSNRDLLTDLSEQYYTSASHLIATVLTDYLELSNER